MVKEILLKQRKADENIGKLIVFAITIIIAVSVVGTLSYFFSQARKNATQLSILTSTASNTADLTGMGFCNADTTQGYVKYNYLDDSYTLVCTGNTNAAVVPDNIKAVRGIIVDDANCSGNECKYKVNR